MGSLGQILASPHGNDAEFVPVRMGTAAEKEGKIQMSAMIQEALPREAARAIPPLQAGDHLPGGQARLLEVLQQGFTNPEYTGFARKRGG
jgi:hypothetical protein